MEIRSKIAENYLKKFSKPKLDDFLNYSCEQMFLSYVIKTLKETRKQYYLQQIKLKEIEIELDDSGEFNNISINDNYDIFFDELINCLPDKEKKFIILCFKFGYKDTAVARKMKISPQAAYGLKQRALNNIRKEFFDFGR